MSGRAILIVEDERIVAMDLQRTLRDFGYDAYAVASSADQAISIAAERVPDLALMDIRLRGPVDGIDVARVLRDRLGVPIVFLTAHADVATLERAKLTGPFGYLLKPYRPAELRSVVEIALYKHGTEQRLVERERWMSTTLHSIADGVILVDGSARVSFANAAAGRLLGDPGGSLVGRALADLFDSGVIRGGSLEAIEEGLFMRRQEVRVRCTVGPAAREVEAACSPVVDTQRNALLGGVIVMHDVTDRLRRLREAEQTERLVSLGTMAAGTVHEVNNPLAVVLANAELILGEIGARGDEVPELSRLQDQVSDVLVAARRIERVMEDLRTFYRPSRHDEPSSDVHTAVRWAVRSTAHLTRPRAKVALTLLTVPRANVPEAKLSQVLVNLIVNAAHAIPVGAAEANLIEILVRLEEAGTHVRIEVRDSGRGMTDEVKRRLFEPFFTTKGPSEGSGLGLSICHGIVAAAGGEILVDSGLGRGTTFTLRLPVSTEVPADLVAEGPRVASRRLRLLLVDDEVALLRVMVRILKQHDAVCVEGGRDALAEIERDPSFDVIVSDLTMPNMSGAELHRELAHRAPDLARRMVFVSGGSLSPSEEEFLSSLEGVVYLAKPFEPSELHAALARKLALIGH